MQSAPAQNDKEPLKLKVILPLLGVILVLGVVFSLLNYSRAPFQSLAPTELGSSFLSFARKNKDFEHFLLFSGQKKVNWEQGLTLAGLLRDLEGGNSVASVSLSYQIPVFINLVGDWSFSFENSTFFVQAPMPLFGEASLVPSSVEIHFNSVVTDEQRGNIQQTLKDSLASYRFALDSGSRQTLEGESQKHIEELLIRWLRDSFKNLPELKFQITFSGSKEPGPSEEL